jgi:hydrogenase expression/formation protein HypD
VVAELKTALDETARRITRPVAVMHVCGTHEHEIGRYALRQLLPENVRLIAGPGCPVCITPASVIATAIALAEHSSHPLLCTYGDMVRVPIDGGSLLDARGRGADIRVIYGIRDAAKLAFDHPDRQVVFFSVGFETTAAPVAALLKSGLPQNLSIYCCHRYVPAALRVLCEQDISAVDGFLLPGHASVITGIEPYRFLPCEYGRASAVAGFEPAEILSGMLAILRQIASGTPKVENCYPRAVRDNGNIVARALIEDVFRPCDAAWRGIGILPGTGLELGESYQFLDSLTRFGIAEVPAVDIMPGCICHLVFLGKNEPTDCPLFGLACTPENPQGPCMVSAEGTCRARFLYPEGSHV